MSERVYCLSCVLLLGFSSAFWWGVLTWLGVADPLPFVLELDTLFLIGHFLFLRWMLKEDDGGPIEPAVHPTEE